MERLCGPSARMREVGGAETQSDQSDVNGGPGPFDTSRCGDHTPAKRKTVRNLKINNAAGS